jgi:replicative DNA helicase
MSSAIAQNIYDAEAEKTVLSILCQHPRETLELLIEETVTRDWFFVLPRAFDVIHGMAVRGYSINFVTLRAALADAGTLEQSGGVGAITEMLAGAVSGNFSHYLDILRTKFLARQMSKLATDITQTIAEDPARAGIELVQFVANAAAEFASYGVRNDSLAHISTMLREAVEKVVYAHKNRGQTLGLATGIHALDRMTNGIRSAHGFYILGRPSHGKSAFMAHIMDFIGTQTDPYQQAECLVFTLEMTGLQLVLRSLMKGAGVSLNRVRDGLMSEDDMPKLMASAQTLSKGRITIDTSSVLSIADIQSRTRRFVRSVRAKRKAKMRDTLAAAGKSDTEIEEAWKESESERLKSDRPDVVIFLDYVQLVKASEARPGTARYLEIKEVCSGLAVLLKDLHIGGVILAQLGRTENEGPDKLPAPSDARECGDIEAFAHEMIAVHRPIMYLLDPEKAEKWCSKKNGGGDDDEEGGRAGGFEWRVGTDKAAGMKERDLTHLMKLVVMKNREGATGSIDVHYEPSLVKFDNWNPWEKFFSNNPREQQNYSAVPPEYLTKHNQQQNHETP